MPSSLRWFLIAPLLLAMVASQLHALESNDDWPMWRHDAGRTAATAHELPATLQLQWKRELPRPAPTYPNDPRMCFDRSYEPVAANKLLFVPSMVTDSVTAFDTATGFEKWVFFADAPVRFAPVAWEQKVFFTADDGFLYCVDAKDGRLLWKSSPLEPQKRVHKLLGDERLISRWPARGGPVISDGSVYFAVGVWPFEGVMVCAVDANTGKPQWVNKDCAFIKDGLLDHSARFDGGLSPQGYLAVLGAKLVVPSGRALPGFFDRGSGTMDPYTSGWGGRVALAKGCWYACGIGDWMFQSGDVYRVHPPTASTTAKPGEYVDVAEFARQMKVSPATMEQWIKQFKLDVVDQNGRRCLRVRNGDEITYLSWWTSAKKQGPRPGEQHALETRTRLEIDPANGKELGVFREPVVTSDAMYYSMPITDQRRNIRDSNDDRKPPRTATYSEIVACDLKSPPESRTLLQGGWGSPDRLVAWSGARFKHLWTLSSPLKVHIKAGHRLYAGSAGTVAAIDIPEAGQSPKLSWRATISGTPSRMLAADGKLFVVTLEGGLYCFGGEKTSAKSYASKLERKASSSDAWASRAAEILKQTEAREGYAIALGLGSGRLVAELARQSKLNLIVIEPDAQKIAAARLLMHKEGLYGSRIQIVPGDLESLRLAPFLASLVVAEEFPGNAINNDPQFVSRLFALLRPYGGKVCFSSTANIHDVFARKVTAAALAGAIVTRTGEFSLLERRGALEGAADWAHESGDAAHTYSSQDRRLVGPLGVLWFGGQLDRTVPWIESDPPRLPGEAAPSPYAGGGPRPRIAAGRMFTGIGDELFATDIYTGRHLWKASIKQLGEFAAVEDSVYALAGGSCLRTDAATGKQLASFAAPGGAPWRQLRVSGDVIVGVTGKTLVCLDRRDGAVRWKISAQRDAFGFAIGSDKVFCVDHWAAEHRDKKDSKTEQAEISALSLSTGKQLWRIQAVTPSAGPASKWSKFAPPLKPQVAFSQASDVLLFSRNFATAAAYKGATGELLWSKEVLCKDPPGAFTSYHPPVVLSDRFVTHSGDVLALKTGQACANKLWKGNGSLRGCGRALGCPHMILMRDGFGSYLDLATGVRTSFRGIRSGCTNTMIPAGGLVSAPNYSHHCNCNYPVYVSLAFAPMTETAAWDPTPAEEKPIASASRR